MTGLLSNLRLVSVEFQCWTVLSKKYDRNPLSVEINFIYCNKYYSKCCEPGTKMILLEWLGYSQIAHVFLSAGRLIHAVILVCRAEEVPENGKKSCIFHAVSQSAIAIRWSSPWKYAPRIITHWKFLRDPSSYEELLYTGKTFEFALGSISWTSWYGSYEFSELLSPMVSSEQIIIHSQSIDQGRPRGGREVRHTVGVLNCCCC